MKEERQKTLISLLVDIRHLLEEIQKEFLGPILDKLDERSSLKEGEL